MPSKNIKVFKWIKRFFSFKGRATRKEWWLVCVFQVFAFMSLFMIISALIDINRMTVSLFLLFLVFFGVLFWLNLATYVRRLHDMDRSGWWAVLFGLTAPLGRFVAMIWLGFFDGTPGVNRFGPNPRVK